MATLVAMATLGLAAGSRLPADVTQWMNVSSIASVSHHLTTNWAVLGEQCVDHSMHMLRRGPRWISVAYGDVARELGLSGKECPQVACLNYGTSVDHLGAAASLRTYRGEEEGEEERFRAWYARVCGQVEVGWVTSDSGLTLYWLNQGQRVSQAELRPEEPEWRMCFIGHQFVLVDDDQEEVARFTISHDAIYVVRSEPLEARKRVSWRTNSTDEKRTALDLRKTTAPAPLFADIFGYWTNNANSTILEGNTTNIVLVPERLGGEWYEAILYLAAEWMKRDSDYLALSGKGYNDGIRSHFDGGGGPFTVLVVLVGAIEFECAGSERIVLGPEEMLLYEPSTSKCKPSAQNASSYFFVAHFETKEGRRLGDDDDDAEPSVVDAHGAKRDWREVAMELERPVKNESKQQHFLRSKRLHQKNKLSPEGRLLPPVDAKSKKRHFVHARKLRSRWRKVLGKGSHWLIFAASSSVVVAGCCALRRRRRRRRGRRSSRSSPSSRPPTGSASPTHTNSRVKTLPSSIRQAARSNRGSYVVEKWLSGKKAADARDAEPPRRALLHHAAAHGSAAVARVVVAAGADPDIIDDAGDAPLHLAAVSGSGAVVKILLEARANPLATDALGKNALERARECNNTGCALLISQKIQSLRSSLTNKAAEDVHHRRFSAHGDSSV